MIQGGDPLGNGTGGPGYSVDEKPPANLAYTKGVVAMAKSCGRAAGALRQPVLRGHSAPTPACRPNTPWSARSARAIDVVDRIGKLGTPAEKPKQTVLIEHVDDRAGLAALGWPHGQGRRRRRRA